MFTNKYRPRSFSQVIGQDTAVSVLKSLASDIERAPKSIILHGAFGCGKTTTARIFSRALFCESFQKEKKMINKDVCLTCPPCEDFNLLYSSASGVPLSRYIEYDSSVMGSKSDIEDMKNLFDTVTNEPRVIVFDEAHLISKAGQSALLKYIEEGPRNTFFLFASTDPDKMLQTILSRSVSVEFQTVDLELIYRRLREISDAEGFKEVTDADLYKVALKSGGHVRNALMTLDVFLLANDRSVIQLPTDSLKKYLVYIQTGAQEQTFRAIDEIMKYPLNEIKKSLFFIVSKTVETYVMKKDGDYKELATLYSNNVFKLLKFISEPWVQEAFNDDSLTYSLFMTMATLLKVQR